MGFLSAVRVGDLLRCGRCVYLVLDEGVDSLQHPLTGELVGQVGLDLIAQTQNADWSETCA